MFTRYLITSITYSVFRNIYYCNNIHITENDKNNNKINRPLLVGEIIGSIGLGVISSYPFLPVFVINDIIYFERKQKNMCLNDEDHIPTSICIACSFLSTKNNKTEHN
jgi:hypothetical protein